MLEFLAAAVLALALSAAGDQPPPGSAEAGMDPPIIINGADPNQAAMDPPIIINGG